MLQQERNREEPAGTHPCGAAATRRARADARANAAPRTRERSGNKVGDAGCAAIARAVEGMPALKMLILE